MKKMRIALLLYPLAMAISTPGAAQNYPARPVRIVTSGLGGSADFVARLIAQGLSQTLANQVVVDNRSNGVVPGEIVSRAAPDGYNLLVSANSLWIGPLLEKNTPYDPAKDFAPITIATRSPNVILVNPSFAAKSVKDLIAMARANPDAINYGSGATGASSHLSAELLKSMAKINMTRIPYKSNAAQITDLLGGRIHLTFSNATAASAQMQAGKLRGLAVTTPQKSPLFPTLPPISDTVPGYDSVTLNAAFGPAKLPAALIKRLNQEMVKVINQPDIKEKFANAGVEAVGSPPEAVASAIKTEVVKWAKVIKEANIKEN